LKAMTILHQVGSLFLHENDLELVFGKIVDADIAMTGTDFGNVQVIDPQSSCLRIVAHRGFPQWWVDYWNEVHEGEGACGTALKVKERIIVEDVEQSPVFIGKPSLEIQIKAGVRAVVSTPIFGRSGNPIGMLSVHFRTPQRPADHELQQLDILARHVADIIERKRAEEELQKSEGRFHTLADNISQLVWIADTNGEGVWYNQRWLDYTGLTPGETKEWDWTKINHPDHVDRVVKGFQRALEYGEPWEDTFLLRSKTGEYRWFLVHTIPIRDTVGNIIHWFATNTDITERQHLLAKEQRLREVAEAQARARDDFLSMVSHELRTPLGAILNYVQLMSAKTYDEKTVAHFCEVIERNALAQQQLIEDLLDTGRIISGKLRLDLSQADLRLLLEETIETVRPAAEGKGVNLTLQFNEMPQKLLCDATRLQQVVWNLLQNAIKFTPEGGQLTLQAERVGQTVRLIVSDTGCGIEPDFLPAIFDRFSQSDMSNTRQHGGLGLGLSLAKQLVEMHGGTIEAASAGAGKGATFTVILPLKAVKAAL
jgi:PAS domain S-box-containing protein